MNTSTLKILVPVLLLVAVVFAVTFFSQVVPPEVEKPKNSSGQDATGQSPLRFSSDQIRMWRPDSNSLQNQFFQGFYETGETQHAATFWFENPTAAPVTMRLLGVSCSACSGGRVAAIPPDVTKQFLQLAAVGALPGGPLAPFSVGMVGPAAQLDAARDTLKWQSYKFDQEPATVVYNIPAAADTDGWSPQWGILELNFKVRPNPKIPLKAAFLTQAQGADKSGKEEFEIYYEPAQGFEVDRPTIDAGDLTDLTTEQTHDVIVYSSTRTEDQLAGLTTRVLMPPGSSGEPGGFVSTGKLVRLAEPELGRFMVDLSNKNGRPIRVRSAFRLPVIIKAQDGQEKLDIGGLERVIWIAKDLEQKSITVKGMVRGPVYLSQGKDINLGTFSTAQGANERVTVTTDQAGIVLELVRDQIRPSYLEVALEKQPSDGSGRGYYQLKVAVPPGKQEGSIRDGAVVLAVKGPTSQRVRFAVRGQGTR